MNQDTLLFLQFLHQILQFWPGWIMEVCLEKVIDQESFIFLTISTGYATKSRVLQVCKYTSSVIEVEDILSQKLYNSQWLQV